MATVEERFWSKVEKTGACWLWRGATNGKGYGHFTPSGRIPRLAHRYAYELLVGPIPDGLTIDHLCRVRNCVNPAHLEPVTSRENTLRGISITAQNARKTECLRGHPYVNGVRECARCKADLAAARWRREHPSPPQRKTHCPQGHHYDATNAYYDPARPNTPRCRKCHANRESVRWWRTHPKEAVMA